MWSHYALEHKGFSIGFNSKHPYFNAKRSADDEFFHLRKVNYCAERPSKALCDMTGDVMLITKSDKWKEEQEWRMLRPLVRPDAVIDEKNEYPIYLFEFPFEAVCEVIMGCNIEHDTKEKIVKLVSEDKRFSHVDLYQAELSDEQYSMNIKKC